MNLEWGSILYVLNGELFSTPLITSGFTDQINWNHVTPYVPDGAVIVANLHFHPDENGINDAIPSYYNLMDGSEGQDWQAYSSFLEFRARGITTDPNMLMYIHTNDPNNLGTWVYDRTDRNTRTRSCAL